MSMELAAVELIAQKLPGQQDTSLMKKIAPEVSTIIVIVYILIDYV